MNGSWAEVKPVRCAVGVNHPGLKQIRKVGGFAFVTDTVAGQVVCLLGHPGQPGGMQLFQRKCGCSESCRPSFWQPSASSFSKSFRAKIGASTARPVPVSSATSLTMPATAAIKPS